MSTIHFTVRDIFFRGKMNRRIRKVEKIKGTHLRYMCCETITVSDRSVSPCLRALSTVSARAAFLCASERCPPSVPDLFLHGAVHRQCPGCVPPCLRALSTVSARCIPSCLSASVPDECCPLSASAKGHLLIPRCVVHHGFLVSELFFVSGGERGDTINGPLPWFWRLSRYTCHGFLVSVYVLATSYDLTMCVLPFRPPVTRCPCYVL